MKPSDSSYALAMLAQLKAEYRVEVIADWGEEEGRWNPGTWSRDELDRLHTQICLLANTLGGPEKFVRHLGGVSVRRAALGARGGQASAHRVTFAQGRSFSAWTVVHEFAHAWDANYGWRLSRLLERYTGGFTSPFLARLIRLAGRADVGSSGPERQPGRQGRKPGCNRAGYFYGDRPSGSNWNFNRREDFAESVAMYIGWGRDNDLSAWAHARLERYLLEDGEEARYFGIDNWRFYSRYFDPPNHDYTATKRWRFVDDLVHGRLTVR